MCTQLRKQGGKTQECVQQSKQEDEQNNISGRFATKNKRDQANCKNSCKQQNMKSSKENATMKASKRTTNPASKIQACLQPMQKQQSN